MELKQFNVMTACVFDIDSWLECGTIISSEAGKLLLAWGQRQWLPLFDSSSKRPVFYFPNFFLDDDNPWFEHPFIGEFSLVELQKKLLSRLDQIEAAQLAHPWVNPYLATFTQAFSALQTKINGQVIDKAVPYIFELAPLTMTKAQRLRSLVCLLQYASENPVFMYGFWDGDQGVLGATPELLFQLDEASTIKTMACAGTVENDQPANQAFMQDPKEIHEHQLVIQGIEESLGAFGKVHVGTTQLLKLATLSHLMTPIEVHLNPATADFEKIVHALHPTPALGAFPRRTGMQWLKEYQLLVPRRRFGAPVGYLLPAQKRGLCYVAIRNVQWDKQAMRIGAGCGVVAGSQCEREWREINLKLRAIKEMLAL